MKFLNALLVVAATVPHIPDAVTSLRIIALRSPGKDPLTRDKRILTIPSDLKFYATQGIQHLVATVPTKLSAFEKQELLLTGTTNRPKSSEQELLLSKYSKLTSLDSEEDGQWISSESEETTTTTKKPKSRCDCLPIYFPVCANNITFLNQCEFECARNKRIKHQQEPIQIQCTGACDRCIYLPNNPAVEYDADYYIPQLPAFPTDPADDNQKLKFQTPGK